MYFLKFSSRIDQLSEKLIQHIVVIIIEYLFEIRHALLHIMETFYLGRINIQISDDTPQVREFSGLLLIHFLYIAGIIQYFSIFFTHESFFFIIIDLQFFETINQLISFRNIILLGNHRMQQI